MKVKYELCVGMEKGHKVTKLDKKIRPAAKKGVSRACAFGSTDRLLLARFETVYAFPMFNVID